MKTRMKILRTCITKRICCTLKKLDCAFFSVYIGKYRLDLRKVKKSFVIYNRISELLHSCLGIILRGGA